MVQWKIVRLELGQTAQFPDGSASRAYILRLPLNDAGLIDGAALARDPAMGTVRRFWPNEADQTGYLVKNSHGWAFAHSLDGASGHGDGNNLFHLEPCPIRLGASVALTGPDGERLPFRVVREEPDGVGAGASASRQQARRS